MAERGRGCQFGQGEEPHREIADGRAPVAVRDYAKGRVTNTDGRLDQPLAACIDDLMSDAAVPKLPSVEDAVAANQSAVAAIAAIARAPVPIPFLLAMFVQESGSCHYSVPTSSDIDSFVVVGLDHGDNVHPDRVTSRGYGIGQFTIFHHPPRLDEVATFIVDPVDNVRAAISELGEKFHGFVAGPTDRADDRDVEHVGVPLRTCRYKIDDPLYLEDCSTCARTARRITVARGTPLYDGSQKSYQPDKYYPSADYGSVPDRSDFLCDWPYAARRYNGSGLDSFHYQTRILRNLERLPVWKRETTP